MTAFENELKVIKSELEKIKQLRFTRVNSVEVCMDNVTKRVMENPEKVKELSDYLR